MRTTQKTPKSVKKVGEEVLQVLQPRVRKAVPLHEWLSVAESTFKQVDA